MGDVTSLLERLRQGDNEARNSLWERVYAELHRLARQKLARQGALTQLNAASLVHEAYLRLVHHADLPGRNRATFLGYASGVMRSVIIDYVRERNAKKRGRAAVHVTLTGVDIAADGPAFDMELLESALLELSQIDERMHRIVEMRYFGGMSVEEIADVLASSPATVKREWQKARAFLYRALKPT